VNRWFYRRASRIVAVSTAIGKVLVDAYRVPSDRIEVLPAIPALPLRPHAPQPGDERSAVIGFAGRLTPEKGVDVFLRAASLVARVVPEPRFVVIGDGRLGELGALAGDLGLLEESVRFLGFRDDAADLIAGLDILAVPSRSDDTPLVVMRRDPIRMLARVTRSRQCPLSPTLLRERGAVAATNEPGQVEVLDDGSVVIVRGRSRKDRGPCAGVDRQAPPLDVAAGGQQDAAAGQLPQHASTSRSWEVKAFIVSPLRSAFRRARDLARRNHFRHLPWAAPSGDPGAPGRLRQADPRLPGPNLHPQSGTSNVFLETV
jgi:glycosyltransferase involved in cell wall biosynthesis